MKRRVRKSRVAIISLFLVGAIIFGSVYFAWNTVFDIFQPVNAAGQGKTIHLVIMPGENAGTIADDLQVKGLIRNAFAFRIWAKIKGLDTHLQAGGYSTLNSSMTISDIIDVLLLGQPDLALPVTIPEGWRLEQIAARFATAGLANFKASDFLKYVKHIDQFPDASKFPILQTIPKGNSMEGFLFPNTYEFSVNANAVDVVDTMLKEFTTIVQQNSLDKLAKQNKLTFYQMVTLASIVERETRWPGDRPTVASVYWNRILRPNDETVGKLQADPTVQYARDSENPPKTYWTPLQDSGGNIAKNSPWNTYIVQGWPPSPIASPGLASLQAAAAPAKTNYYFFLTRNDTGRNVYSETFAQFQQLEQQYPH